MAYTIHHADGTAITVADGTTNKTFYNQNANGSDVGTGIRLIGRNQINYGAPIAQNFLQQAENFASYIGQRPTDTYALQGQLWFEKTSDRNGRLFVRTGSAWHRMVTSELLTAATGDVELSTNDSGSIITELSGILSEEASGSYTLANITVDTKGRITRVSSGTLSASDLPDISSVTGSYTLASISVDTKGRITRVSSGTHTDTTTASDQLTSDSSSNIANTKFVHAVAGDSSATAVSAALPDVTGLSGSYTNANITVNAKGLITTAANGVSGATVTISDTAPTTPTLGSLWYDSGDEGRAFIWTGTAWIDFSPGVKGDAGSPGAASTVPGPKGDPGDSTVGGATVSSTAPSAPSTGALWYDSGDEGRAYVWTGTAWLDFSPAAAAAAAAAADPVPTYTAPTRVLNTEYMNTETTTIFIEVNVQVGSGQIISLYKNGSLAQKYGNNTGVTTDFSIASIIIPGQLYKIASVGTPSFTWYETKF